MGRERAVSPFSEAFFWFVGAWLGDGWTDLRQRPHRSPGQTVGNILIGVGFDDADEFQTYLEKTGLRFRRYRERTTMRYVITSRPLARWLREHFGRYSHGKHLPAWVLGMPEAWRRSLWEGYIWTDGSQQAHGMSFNSVSKSLIIGMRLLGQSLGYVVSFGAATRHRTEAVIEGRVIHERPQWQSRVFYHPRSSMNDGRYAWGRVRSCEPTHQVEEVFNLEVADDHSYTADGMVVHNCQSFSVAGGRAGLAGASGLFWEFLRIADSQPRAWVLWENVPGVLSLDAGATFALILWGFTGYRPRVPAGGWSNSGVCTGSKRAVAWRVLDAQHFGVPQRRRRLYLVGHPVDRGDCAEILFESESLPGHLAARPSAGQIAPTLLANGAGANRPAGIASETDFCIVDEASEEGVMPLAIRTDQTGANGSGMSPVAHTVHASGAEAVAFDARNLVVGSRRNGTVQAGHSLNFINSIILPGSMYGISEQPTPKIGVDVMPTLVARETGGGQTMAVACPAEPLAHTLTVGGRTAGRRQEDDANLVISDSHASCSDSEAFVIPHAARIHVGKNVAPTLRAQSCDRDAVMQPGLRIRRLLPIETERLMGIEDDWTRWRADGSELSDTARYRICGNGVAVPVVVWIARRMARALTAAKGH